MKKIILTLTAVLTLFGWQGTLSAALPEYGEEWQQAPVNAPAVSFSDLAETHWAYSYIADMANRKVLEGYPDNKFRPDNTVSRAEFATIIIKAAGIQPQKVNYSSFSDVKVTDWYSPFIEAVKDYMTGIRTADGQYIFNPTAPALREDITVALVKLKGYDVARLSNRSIIEAMFRDYAGISESAKDYVAVAVENGLVSGYKDETFRPQVSVTRAEAATLLWRAYQFGNDNKAVGGDSSNTTPTPPVTQPGQPSTPNPATPSQPQQPGQAVKFSVDTLVGGVGYGDVDGPVRTARINKVDSMVVDKHNNIYFLDSQNKKIRRFNAANGTVETFKQIDHAFDWQYKGDDGQTKQFEHKFVTPWKLAYDYANDKLYLAAQSTAYGTYEHAVVFDVSSSVNVATYADYADYYRYNFIAFPASDSILVGQSRYDVSTVSLGQLDGAAMEIIAKSQSYNEIDLSQSLYAADAAALTTTDNLLYIIGKNKLYQMQLYPMKVTGITEYSNSIGSVAAYNGKFYASREASIYEVGLDGSMRLYVDGEDLIYNDGNPIQQMSQLQFDQQGNILFYDNASNAIRRINL